MFDDACFKAFEFFKERFTLAPIIMSPHWTLPFEVICDASGMALGSVLSQR